MRASGRRQRLVLLILASAADFLAARGVFPSPGTSALPACTSGQSRSPWRSGLQSALSVLSRPWATRCRRRGGSGNAVFLALLLIAAWPHELLIWQSCGAGRGARVLMYAEGRMRCPPNHPPFARTLAREVQRRIWAGARGDCLHARLLPASSRLDTDPEVVGCRARQCNDRAGTANRPIASGVVFESASRARLDRPLRVDFYARIECAAIGRPAFV